MEEFDNTRQWQIEHDQKLDELMEMLEKYRDEEKQKRSYGITSKDRAVVFRLLCRC